MSDRGGENHPISRRKNKPWVYPCVARELLRGHHGRAAPGGKLTKKKRWTQMVLPIESSVTMVELRAGPRPVEFWPRAERANPWPLECHSSASTLHFVLVRNIWLYLFCNWEVSVITGTGCLRYNYYTVLELTAVKFYRAGGSCSLDVTQSIFKRLIFVGLLFWEGDNKRGAFTQSTFDSYSPIMTINYFFTYGKANSGSFVFASSM